LKAVGLDTKQLDQIMGYNGKMNGGVYQFGIPRAEKIMADIARDRQLRTMINSQNMLL
jgi:hypothetical protein